MIDGTYGVNPSHLSIPEIDIFSNHYYPTDNAKLSADIASVASANKTYIVGEYDWIGNNPSSSSLDSFFEIIESRQKLPNPVVVGDQPWSLFGHNAPDCGSWVQHNDGFTLHYNDPSSPELHKSQIKKIRRHFWRLLGKEVGLELPAAPCPGPLSSSSYVLVK